MTRAWSLGLIISPQDLIMGVRYGALCDGSGWGVTFYLLPGFAIQFTSLKRVG